MTMQLRSLGHEVTSAGDGSSALMVLSKKLFALAITDILMPEQDGIGFLLAAKKMKPKMPVIVMTGHLAPLHWDNYPPMDYLGNARRLGADEALSKPFTVADLKGALDRCLEAVPT